MKNRLQHTAIMALLTLSLMLSTAFSSAAPNSITSKQYLEIMYSLTDCTTVEELVEQHYINESEADILHSSYPYAALIQRTLSPLFGIYPYPNELYPDHPNWAVGDRIYVDAATALWSIGWEPRSYRYTYDEVLELMSFLEGATLEPPINSQFDVDITRESYVARNSLMRAWENIPQKHKYYMEDNGWAFEYHTTAVESSDNDWNSCSGCTSYTDKRIYLFECTEGTVYHEMGHMLTWMAGTKDVHKILYDLEAKRGKRFMRDYAQTTENEFIACAFTEYFENPDLLKKYCPLTYTFIDRTFYNCKYSCDVYFVEELKKNPVATLIKEAVMP